MISTPCYGCADRCMGCHGTCEKYKSYRDKMDDVKEKSHEASERFVAVEKTWKKARHAQQQKMDKKREWFDTNE